MERLLEVFVGISVLGALVFAVLRERALRAESVSQRRSTRAEFGDRETAITEGVLMDLEKEFFGDQEGSGPVFINCYLVYEFSPASTNETLRGKHSIAREKILEPGFPLEIGKPVLVRYAVDDPAVSELVDF